MEQFSRSAASSAVLTAPPQCARHAAPWGPLTRGLRQTPRACGQLSAYGFCRPAPLTAANREAKSSSGARRTGAGRLYLSRQRSIPHGSTNVFKYLYQYNTLGLPLYIYTGARGCDRDVYIVQRRCAASSADCVANTLWVHDNADRQPPACARGPPATASCRCSSAGGGRGCGRPRGGWRPLVVIRITATPAH